MTTSPPPLPLLKGVLSTKPAATSCVSASSEYTSNCTLVVGSCGLADVFTDSVGVRLVTWPPDKGDSIVGVAGPGGNASTSTLIDADRAEDKVPSLAV